MFSRAVGLSKPGLAVGLALAASAAPVALGAGGAGPALALGAPPQDACPAVQGEAGGGAPCDTMFTPVAKDPEGLWKQVGGAVFGATGSVVKGSPTPFTVDFFAVRFLGSSAGLAGGAACADPSTSFSGLDSCPRVPAIYQYSETPGQPGQWTQVALPGGAGGPDPKAGYVGAIAWIGPGKALAVGGDGVDPRREPAAGLPTDPPPADLAGHARAWLYESGSWSELDLSGMKTQGEPMGGLTAVDCSPRPSDGEFCIAGGLHQLWMFHDGVFTKGYSDKSPDAAASGSTGLENPLTAPTSPSTEVSHAADFRFRVRSISFAPGSDAPWAQAVAVTDGCCSADPAQDMPRVAVWDGVRWYVEILQEGQAAANNSTPNGLDSTPYTQTVPDSFLSARVIGTSGPRFLSVIASPGGTAAAYPAGEPASRVIGNMQLGQAPPQADALNLIYSGVTSEVAIAGDAEFTLFGDNAYATEGSDVPRELATPVLSSLRLVAGDGDAGGPRQSDVQHWGLVPPSTPDGAPDHTLDWAVGDLDVTGEGVAYTTLSREQGLAGASGNPLDCPSGAGVESTSLWEADCQPDQAGATDVQSHSLYLLGSFALNAFSMADAGSGWAAGDKGALVQLAGQGSAEALSAEPPAPHVGAPDAAAGAGTAPYAGFYPAATTAVGAVPAVGQQPLQWLAAPVMTSAGSPDTTGLQVDPEDAVSSIVMSADGSEGWALGSPAPTGFTAGSTMYHFDGTTWRPCDADGVAGVVDADPACASLAPVHRYFGPGHKLSPVAFTAAAGVPRSGPGSGDFEVVAAGTLYRMGPNDPERPAIAIYRNGRWQIDEQAMDQIDPQDHPQDTFAVSGAQVTDLAFTGPDDGWMVANLGNALYRLLHYDGTRWQACSSGPGGPCEDAGGLLPQVTSVPGTALHLARSGERVYLYGARSVGATRVPLILYRDAGPCRRPGDSGCWQAAGGGLDPGASAQSGSVVALSAAPAAGAGYEGWAIELLGNGNGSYPGSGSQLLHLSAGSESWTPWSVADASQEYPLLGAVSTGPPGQVNPALRQLSAGGAAQLVALPGGRAFLSALNSGRTLETPQGPLLEFDPGAGRWRVAPSPFDPARSDQFETTGIIHALAPDGQGGVWLAVRRFEPSGGDPSVKEQGSTWFFDYTDRPPEPVFSDVTDPVREQITDLAGGADGTVWVTTASGVIYRYDRLTGWDRFAIGGWQTGLGTVAARATAVAVGPDGRGVVVGQDGRIGDVGPAGAVIDRASKVTCAASGGAAPCGTGRSLRAAAVAPDGSAMVGGDDRALLWRPARAAFRAIPPPRMGVTSTITAISMPASDRAWVSTDSGQIFVGTRGPDGWSWGSTPEDVAGDGLLVSLRTNSLSSTLAVRGLAVDAAGEGYAVGDDGLIMIRDPGGANPWKRLSLDAVPQADLESVAMPAGGGTDTAIIGGENGLVLTARGGDVAVADPGDPWRGITGSMSDNYAATVPGVAVLPGDRAGQVEAWAAVQVPPDYSQRLPTPGAILHYSSDPSDPLLDAGVGRVAPLPDSPAPQPGELSFAAFGKQDCSVPEDAQSTCPEAYVTGWANDEAAARIDGQLAAQASAAGGPSFALFTGDASDGAGRDDTLGYLTDLAPTDPSVYHERWGERVADPLLAAGVPVFAALGVQDLSRIRAGTTATGAGSALPWRLALAASPAPLGASGSDPPPASHGLSFEPVAASAPDAPGGGAHTHYAFDVVRRGSSVLRVVEVDTALRSLSATADENPVESQLEWLSDVLSGRPSGERAVVVSETPSYSYGPGQGTDTLVDSAAFEALMGKDRVSAVVSGRLGWNGLFYTSTLAPGLHCPQPGGGYPAAGCSPASAAEGGGTAGAEDQALSTLAGALSGVGAPAPPPTGAQLDAYPTVIAASGGGKFGPQDSPQSGSADQGYWHGYSVVRLLQDGSVIVEQRPVFDWIGILGVAHDLEPGQHLRLDGYGREPVGTDAAVRYDDIGGPAITHRYDLVQANPSAPYLPLEAAGGGYVPLDPGVATIDRETGFIQTGSGSHGRVYALAVLSVGGQAASFPVVFEPARSYVPSRPLLPRPAVSAPPAPAPPVHIAAAGPVPPPLPSSAPPTPPEAVNPSLPQLPGHLPPPPVAVLAPPTPPLPPTPPPPSAQPTPLPLALQAKLAPVGVNATVVPPSPPPVNPAPPSGSAARKEAKQRQAATAKSEEGGGEGSVSEAQTDVDLGRGGAVPGGAAMTRHSPGAADRHAFTALVRPGELSAWPRDLLYAGGIGAAALILALGVMIAGSTPRRRRSPHLPAPAWARHGTPPTGCSGTSCRR